MLLIAIIYMIVILRVDDNVNCSNKHSAKHYFRAVFIYDILQNNSKFTHVIAFYPRLILTPILVYALMDIYGVSVYLQRVVDTLKLDRIKFYFKLILI